MRVNIWLALRQNAHDKVRNELVARRDSTVPRESTIPEWIARFFELGTEDWSTAREMWRQDRVWWSQGAVYRKWHLWNLYYTDDLPLVKKAVEELTSQYPDMVKLVGAWDKNGKALTPIDPRVLEFMPDLVASDGSVWRPETPRDYNLLLGQQPREWVFA